MRESTAGKGLPAPSSMGHRRSAGARAAAARFAPKVGLATALRDAHVLSISHLAGPEDNPLGADFLNFRISFVGLVLGFLGVSGNRIGNGG